MNQMVSHIEWSVDDDGPVSPNARRAQDRELVGDLEHAAPEAEHRRRTAPAASGRSRLAGRLEEPPTQQNALQIRRGYVVPERSLVDRPKLGNRERGRRKSEADVRIGELGPEPLPTREHDVAVIERERRQAGDGMPPRVIGYGRVDVLRH